ncbi:MAG: thiolase family protein [Actinobacteria bacterium]|nr:thiolase family protein [Actinomycetota bacterium]
MDAMIVGTGMTQFGMFVQTRLADIAGRAADDALRDAGVDPSEIGLVIFANAAAGLITGQEMIRAHTSLATSLVAGRPMVSVENACASSSSAFHLGAMSVACGQYDFVLVVGAEKMTSEDKTRAGKALMAGVDVELGPRPEEAGPGATRPVFMEIYAAQARDYMSRSAATVDDFARVAAKNHLNGSLNPNAQVRSALTPEEVLAARVIVDPLTRPMCSSISDGAAAVVLASPRAARRRGLHGPKVLATALGASSVGDLGDIVERTARAAYEQAGLGASEIDLFEVHDAAAPAELIIAEELGLASSGEAASMFRDGTANLGGRYPINPSGGLLARGHPVGATGAAQIVELADQLRGRAGSRQVKGARVALSENAGGWLGNGAAACGVTILAAV